LSDTRKKKVLAKTEMEDAKEIALPEESEETARIALPEEEREIVLHALRIMNTLKIKRLRMTNVQINRLVLIAIFALMNAEDVLVVAGKNVNLFPLYQRSMFN
jgi:hypothetical protein